METELPFLLLLMLHTRQGFYAAPIHGATDAALSSVKQSMIEPILL